MTSGRPGDTESGTPGLDPEIPEWVSTSGGDPPSETYRAPRRRSIQASELAEMEQVQESRTPRGRRVRRRRGLRPVLVVVGAIFLVVLLVAVGVLFWINSHLGGAGGAAVQVDVPDQASHATLTSTLSHAHVVSDGWLFQRYLDYRNVPAPAGGSYTFHLHEGYRAALADLRTGPHIVQTKVTIPEGYDIKQIAAVVGTHPGLSAQRFLDLANTGAVHSPYQPPGSNNLEGLLFPDTYFISPQDTEQTILQRMVDRFNQVAVGIGLDASAQSNGLSPYQTVVLASLIEREAKIDADRAKISRVIANRLAAGMKLQIDATVEYAEGVHKTRLLNSDLRTQSPYNTYLVTGLPPGPIGGPGRASLIAALQPTPGTWLYYVLIDKSGAHGFATTAAEFERLKQEAHAKGLL